VRVPEPLGATFRPGPNPSAAVVASRDAKKRARHAHLRCGDVGLRRKAAHHPRPSPGWVARPARSKLWTCSRGAAGQHNAGHTAGNPGAVRRRGRHVDRIRMGERARVGARNGDHLDGAQGMASRLGGSEHAGSRVRPECRRTGPRNLADRHRHVQRDDGAYRRQPRRPLLLVGGRYERASFE
jgi:hypothetical protein